MSDIFGDKDWFIVDDILTEKEQNDLERYLTGPYFPFYLSRFLSVTKKSYDKFKHLPNCKDHIQMVHQFYKIDDKTNDTIIATDDKHLVWINLLLKKMATYLKLNYLEVMMIYYNHSRKVKITSFILSKYQL